MLKTFTQLLLLDLLCDIHHLAVLPRYISGTIDRGRRLTKVNAPKRVDVEGCITIETVWC